VDLDVLADSYLGQGNNSFLPDSGPVSNRLLLDIGHEDHVAPLVASVFWAAFVFAPTFSGFLLELGLNPEDRDRRLVVVQHGEYLGRYDLFILDRARRMTGPSVARIQPDSEALAAGWRSLLEFSRRSPKERYGSLTLADLEQVAVESSSSPDFGVLVAGLPEVISTTATRPAPAWTVTSGTGEIASVGIIGTDLQGRSGVTSANHAIAAGDDQVTVNGIPGTVVSRDLVTDSCFIKVGPIQATGCNQVSGPLAGVSPRVGEDVTFDGVRSGHVMTRVRGFDPGIPWISQPWVQLSVTTKPVTVPGDSGAALVNGDGNVIGFASYRTGFQEEVEFSAWIWAESVFRAHGLK
jgi:hypothetical protein